MKRVFGPLEIGLTVGLVVAILFGVGYTGLAGIIKIPGVPPLLASLGSSTDKEVSPSPALSDQSTPTTQTTVEPTASAVVAATPSPTISSSPAVTEDPMMVRDKQRKQDLATLQTGLAAYFQKNKSKRVKYPQSETFATGRTDSSQPILKLLVSDGYLPNLPTDPRSPEFWYGYQSDGNSYSLSARLENTADPEGHYLGDLYLYTVSNP